MCSQFSSNDNHIGFKELIQLTQKICAGSEDAKENKEQNRFIKMLNNCFVK